MGHRSLRLLGALGIALAMAGKAPAHDDETRMDVRCVVVSARLSTSPDVGQRTRAGMLMIYYIGRLDGRTPGLDLEHLLANESANMTSEEVIQSETRRCNDALVAKGAEITRIGKDLAGQRE